MSPSTKSMFFGRKDISSAVLDFLHSGKLYGIPQISAASGPQRLFVGGAYLTFWSQMRRIFEGGAYSSKYGK